MKPHFKKNMEYCITLNIFWIRIQYNLNSIDLRNQIEKNHKSSISFRVNWKLYKTIGKPSGRKRQSNAKTHELIFLFVRQEKRSNVPSIQRIVPISRYLFIPIRNGRIIRWIVGGRENEWSFRSSLMQEKLETEFPVEVFRLSYDEKDNTIDGEGKSWTKMKASLK